MRETRKELMRLKHHDFAIRATERLRRRLARLDVEQVTREELHYYVDNFQQQLNRLDAAIHATWFNGERA